MFTENYSKWYLNSLNKTISENRDYYYKLSQQADQITVWLVGISITIITLTISNTAKVVDIDCCLPKWIFIICSLTIIWALLYRFFMYWTCIIENRILLQLQSLIHYNENPPAIGLIRKIAPEDTASDIVRIIRENYKMKLNDQFDFENDDVSTQERDILIKLHDTLVEIVEEDFNNGNIEIESVLVNVFGLSKKKANRILRGDTPRNRSFIFLLWTSAILFSLCCLTFVIGAVSFFLMVII